MEMTSVEVNGQAVQALIGTGSEQTTAYWAAHFFSSLHLFCNSPCSCKLYPSRFRMVAICRNLPKFFFCLTCCFRLEASLTSIWCVNFSSYTVIYGVNIFQTPQRQLSVDLIRSWTKVSLDLIKPCFTVSCDLLSLSFSLLIKQYCLYHYQIWPPRLPASQFCTHHLCAGTLLISAGSFLKFSLTVHAGTTLFQLLFVHLLKLPSVIQSSLRIGW